MTKQHQQKVLNLKRDAAEFHEEISREIDDLCNDPEFGFREASKLSHIADRLDLFIKELNEF